MAQGALARARAQIRIPENEPQDAVVTEHAAHLAEDVDQSGNGLLRRRLKTDLAPAALIIAQLIITQLKIWRADHHTPAWLISPRQFRKKELPPRNTPRPLRAPPRPPPAECGRSMHSRRA